MNYRNLPLSQESFFKLFQALDQALHYCLIHSQNNDKVRQSGYFTLRDLSTGRVIFTIMLGDVPKEKQEKYLQLSLEKGDRLYKNYKITFKNFSSWQTRNPDKDMWGGAIRAGIYILSFSGLAELCDEALVLELALTMGWCNPCRLYEISQLSKNIFYRYYNASQPQLDYWKNQR
jgi:hypothetical protein